MSRLDSYTDKMMDLVGQVGDNLRTALPGSAGKWLQTGAALGAAKAGTRVVGTLVRRNPAVLVAAAAAAGVAWYAVNRHRRKQEAQDAVIEGQSRRIDARRAPRKTSGSGTGTRRSTRSKAGTSGNE